MDFILDFLLVLPAASQDGIGFRLRSYLVFSFSWNYFHGLLCLLTGYTTGGPFDRYTYFFLYVVSVLHSRHHGVLMGGLLFIYDDNTLHEMDSFFKILLCSSFLSPWYLSSTSGLPTFGSAKFLPKE